MDDPNKLLQTDDDKVELYDIFDDPTKDINLSDILPEQVEALQQHLQGFMKTAHLVEESEEVPAESSDPQIYRRLHDLGYLE